MEAIEILYRTTTFKFDDRETFASFPSLVLPQRFALITAIEMDCNFDELGESTITAESRQPYNEMWALLASMPNLSHLDIQIRAGYCPYQPPADLKEVWLGPLKQMGEMEVFDVQIPASYCYRFSSDVRHDFLLPDVDPAPCLIPFNVDGGSNFTLRALAGREENLCKRPMRFW